MTGAEPNTGADQRSSCAGETTREGSVERLREELDCAVEIAERLLSGEERETDVPTIVAHLHVMQEDWADAMSQARRAQVDPPATAPEKRSGVSVDWRDLQAGDVFELSVFGNWGWERERREVVAVNGDVLELTGDHDRPGVVYEWEPLEDRNLDQRRLALVAPAPLIEAVAVTDDLRTTPSGVSEIEALQAEVLALRAARDKAEHERDEALDEAAKNLAEIRRQQDLWTGQSGLIGELAAARDKAERALRPILNYCNNTGTLNPGGIFYAVPGDLIADAREALGGSGAAVAQDAEKKPSS